MTRKAAITGIGVVLPDTQTLKQFWAQQLSATSPIRALSDRIWGSAIDKDKIDSHLSPRLAKKLDAFSRYALVATQRAIDDAALDLKWLDRERCGVFVGNCFGGWRFTETELRNLHGEGPRAVSPFQATSWFPAAPQGQITIYYGLKGFSKTYMADRASSLLSVASAARMIEQGKLDVAIAGGAESTNTDFVRAVIESIPEAKLPSSSDASFTMSEGAVFLILEDSERAVQRGAKIYAQVDGFAMNNAPCETDRYSVDPDPLIRSMRRALGNRQPGLVMPDASGLRGPDLAEAHALREVCVRTPVVIPKRKFGHSFGAEGAVDIAYASLMIHRQQVLPKSNGAETAGRGSGKASQEAVSARIDSVLINGCATGGSACSLLLSQRSA